MRNSLISLALLVQNSSPTATDVVRKTLEAASERWFRWLLLSSSMVAVGCILEIGETGTGLKRWIRLKRGLPVKEEDPKSWFIPIGAVGLVLVIAGVVGEGGFEAAVSNADTALRAYEAGIIDDAESKAAIAISDAAGADERAGIANRKAGEANEKARTLSLDEEKIRNENLRLQTQLEQEKLALVAVKEKYAPRTLSKIKRQILIEILSKYPNKPKSPIMVLASISAPDGVSYGEEIAEAISDPASGWHAKFTTVSTTGGELKGVRILTHDAASAPRWAAGLQDALKAAGLGGGGTLSKEMDPGSLVILICPKN